MSKKGYSILFFFVLMIISLVFLVGEHGNLGWFILLCIGFIGFVHTVISYKE